MQAAKDDLQAANFDGVLLGGNYVAGVSLGKCVEFAYDSAAEVAKYLQNKAESASMPVTTGEDDAFFV